MLDFEVSDRKIPPESVTQARVGHLSHYIIRLVPIFLALVAVSVTHRIMALRLYIRDIIDPMYHPNGFAETVGLLWTFHGDSLMGGAALDMIFAILFAGFLALGSIPGAIRILAIFGLIVFHAANYEHIKYNFGHINLATAGLGLSPTFLMAQATTGLFKALTLLAIIASTVSSVTWLILRRFLLSPSGWILRSGIVFSLSCLMAFAIFAPKGASFFEPEWMGTHPLFPRFGTDEAIVDQRPFADLGPSQTTVSIESVARYNLLVVYMESVSARSIKTGEMKKLSGLARENISLQRYFGNQLVTANGLYSTLTGGRPYFLSKSLRWSGTTAESELARSALPSQFLNAGYSTSFLQSAELTYMKKDRVLPRLGFETLKGFASWSDAYSVNGWGVDDRTLFENTLEYIDGLDQNQPWFVSILTAGTHAPYNVPSEILGDRLATRSDALTYLDSALGEFIDGLEKRNLLSNTVVILTSDESRERSYENAILDELYLYWLPLVVIHPGRIAAEIDANFATTDFPEIVAALIGDANIQSLRQKRENSHPLVFANLHTRRLFYFSPSSGELFYCKVPAFECALFENIADPLEIEAVDPAKVAIFPKLAEVIARSDSAR